MEGTRSWLEKLGKVVRTGFFPLDVAKRGLKERLRDVNSRHFTRREGVE